MAYDAARHQIVLFGGGTDQALSDETWTWQAGKWTQQHPTTSPPARVSAGMAYDAALKLVVLYGGFGGNYALGDTWVWDGHDWAKGQIGPENRCGPAMAYDAAHERIVMFGGDCAWLMDDTWTWNRAWTQQFPRFSPPGRSYARMTYDTARRQIVMFGGTGNRDGSDRVRKDTWTWDGATWTKHHTAASPIGLTDMGMADDAARDQVVIFGGSDPGGTKSDQTWTWDGLRWMRQFPAQSPSPRYAPSMAYDTAAGIVVLFGGWNGRDIFGDTWTWDGSEWQTSP